MNVGIFFNDIDPTTNNDVAKVKTRNNFTKFELSVSKLGLRIRNETNSDRSVWGSCGSRDIKGMHSIRVRGRRDEWRRDTG